MGRLSRITINDAQCGGRSCIRGMKMRVSLEDHSYLEREDILAAIECAARQTDHAVVLTA